MVKILHTLKQHIHHSLSALQPPAWTTSWRAKALVVVLVIIFGGAYIAETTALSTSGYVIHNLQNQIDAKTAEIQKLESKVAGYQSMNSIQARLGSVQLVPVDKISYISVVGSNHVAER